MPIPARYSLRRLLLSHELAFLVLVLVTALLGGGWAYFWQKTSREAVRLNHMAHLSAEIRATLFRQIKDVALARLRNASNAEQVHDRYTDEIKQNFNALRRTSQSRAEDYAVQALQQAYGELHADMNAMFDDVYLLNRIVRIKLLDPIYEQALVGDFEAAFDSFRGLINQRLNAQQMAMGRWHKIAPWVMPVPLLIAVGILFLSWRSLRDGFVAPIQRIVSGANRISAGKFEERLDIEGASEVTELASGINQMAQDLVASRDALVEQERQAALGALVPVVAHNIRNPLASIRATAQLLQGTNDVTEIQESAGLIITTVDRLGRWVNSLVSYLHPLELQLSTVRVEVLWRTVLELMHPRLIERSIRVTNTVPANVVVTVDQDLMEQALYGLLCNAVDVTPSGGQIGIAASVNEEEVVMTIEDGGPGMPFSPTPSNLNPGPTTKRFGTGLGIPFAFKVCKAHGGTLVFGAAQPCGTRVSISVPGAWTDAP